jgi:protein-disulfide isomerase
MMMVRRARSATPNVGTHQTEIARRLDGYTVDTKRKTQRLNRRVSARDHARGSPLAKTTLVAYGDFASPACAQTYRTVKKIQKEMGTRLRYVYRSFPQPEQFPNSEEAAEAAECASSQGKFWEMHDSIFEGDAPTNEAELNRLAAEAGLDLFQFRREMRARIHSEKVRGIREGGLRSGVAAAPAFFINSTRHESSFGLATLLAAVQAVSGDESNRIEREIPGNRKSRRRLGA